MSIHSLSQFRDVSERHTGECLLTARNHNGTDIIIIFVFGQGIVELLEQRAGKGIESLGAVQCDYTDISNQCGFFFF